MQTHLYCMGYMDIFRMRQKNRRVNISYELRKKLEKVKMQCTESMCMFLHRILKCVAIVEVLSLLALSVVIFVSG
jgi:hypothetical protein